MKTYLIILLSLMGCNAPQKPGRTMFADYQDCVRIIALTPNVTEHVSAYYGTDQITLAMAEAYVGVTILNCMRGRGNE
jgi:uncharacterized lipoprotein NlpE involved in copper resistance